MNPSHPDSSRDAEVPLQPPLFLRIGGRERVRLLLRYFYADVRQHSLIGPIFDRQIQDWPTHLETISDFWSNVTGGPMRYAGPLPMKHLSLGLSESHFDAWLDLWRRNCRAHIGGLEAEELIAIAESVGQRIRSVIDLHARAGAPPATGGKQS